MPPSAAVFLELPCINERLSLQRDKQKMLTRQRINSHRLLVVWVEIDHGHHTLVISVEANRDAFTLSKSKSRRLDKGFLYQRTC